jgi:hypothetical protein
LRKVRITYKLVYCRRIGRSGRLTYVLNRIRYTAIFYGEMDLDANTGLTGFVCCRPTAFSAGDQTPAWYEVIRAAVLNRFNRAVRTRGSNYLNPPPHVTEVWPEGIPLGRRELNRRVNAAEKAAPLVLNIVRRVEKVSQLSSLQAARGRSSGRGAGG